MLTSSSLYPRVFLLEAILILLVWESLHCLAFTSGTNLIVYLWTDFCLYSLLSHYEPRFVKSSLPTLSNLALQHVVRQNTTDGLLLNRPSHMECYKHDSTTHLQKYTQTDIQCNHTLEPWLHILTHKYMNQNIQETWVLSYLWIPKQTWNKLLIIYRIPTNIAYCKTSLYYCMLDNAAYTVRLFFFFQMYNNVLLLKTCQNISIDSHCKTAAANTIVMLDQSLPLCPWGNVTHKTSFQTNTTAIPNCQTLLWLI